MIEDLELRQNFISVDSTIARDSYGSYFKIGDEVGHEGSNDFATILSFEIDKESQEVKVNTSKGHCHLDFIFLKEEDEDNS